MLIGKNISIDESIDKYGEENVFRFSENIYTFKVDEEEYIVLYNEVLDKTKFLKFNKEANQVRWKSSNGFCFLINSDCTIYKYEGKVGNWNLLNKFVYIYESKNGIQHFVKEGKIIHEGPGTIEFSENDNYVVCEGKSSKRISYVYSNENVRLFEQNGYCHWINDEMIKCLDLDDDKIFNRSGELIISARSITINHKYKYISYLESSKNHREKYIDFKGNTYEGEIEDNYGDDGLEYLFGNGYWVYKNYGLTVIMFKNKKIEQIEAEDIQIFDNGDFWYMLDDEEFIKRKNKVIPISKLIYNDSITYEYSYLDKEGNWTWVDASNIK